MGEPMTVRRYVFPTLWLVIFAVIAGALFKLAFVDGLQAEATAGNEQASAQLTTPVVPAALGTVTNLVQVQGSVVSDPLVTVKSTGEGIVDFIYVEAGEEVDKGAPLFQLKILLEQEQQVPGPQEDDGEPPAPAAPLYTYADVVATSDGTLTELMVLPKQQVAVGADVASLDPGTYSVSGTLTSAQQFRILNQQNTASVTINGGPAPFPCSNVSMGKTPAAETGVSTQARAAGPAQSQAETPAAGSVSCSVPREVPVFAGLGAAIDITAGQAVDVVTVPTTAVQGAVQTGVVWVAAAGEAADAVEREVGLGLNDGQSVEVTSGLAEGEMILQFVPGAPAAVDGQGNAMPGVMGG